MKILGKICLMIILKVRKNKGFTPSLENENPKMAFLHPSFPPFPKGTPWTKDVN